MGNCVSGQSAPFDYRAQLFAKKKKQTVFVGRDAHKQDNPDCTETWRAAGQEEELLSFPTVNGQEVYTVWEMVEASARVGGDDEFLGTRAFLADGKRGDYVYYTVQEMKDEAEAVGRGLLECVPSLQPEDCVGIYAKNRVEWTVTNLANATQKLRTVALYDTLSPDAIEYILAHAELKVVCTSKAGIPKLVAAKKANPELQFTHVVQFDTRERLGNTCDAVEDEHRALCEEAGLTLLSYVDDVLARGLESDKELNTATTEDLAFIMYTSGTTGAPKGVMLSHGNCMAAVAGAEPVLNMVDGGLTNSDRHISYLPLAHIFEFLVQLVCVATHMRVMYFGGNVKNLVEDFNMCRPTLLCGVPRVFSKMYDKVNAKLRDEGCLKQWYVNRALTRSSELIRENQRDATYDGKVWSSIATTLGFDEVRLLVSGAAPLPPYLAEWLKLVCFKSVICQGYGLTETTAGSSIVLPGDITLGHVGPPCRSVEFKLEDVPEMGYLHTDECPRGEICMRGPTIFKGYYKNPDKTAEAVDEDGWFHTGDVGRINPNGTLSIIDRKKNIFKTQMGEYIAAERLENTYSKAASVAQFFLYGNSYKAFVVAVVVPDMAWTRHAAKELRVWGDCEDEPGTSAFLERYHQVWAEHGEQLKQALRTDLKQYEGQLKGFEKVRDVICETNIEASGFGFTVDNDLMTPSFKLRRPQLLRKYVDQLKELYAANGSAPQDSEVWLPK